MGRGPANQVKRKESEVACQIYVIFKEIPEGRQIFLPVRGREFKKLEKHCHICILFGISENVLAVANSLTQKFRTAK